MPTYEVSLWQRAPAVTGAPTFAELDPIASWTKLQWERTLNEADKYKVTADVHTISDTLATKLIALDATPLELQITRDGTVVGRGPVIDWEIHNNELTLNARGLLYYLEYMVYESAFAATNTDQATIIKTLIDNYQALSYGNYGLVTTSLTAVGVTRMLTIKTGEFPTLAKKVKDWSDNLNGMDLWVDPATRSVYSAYPTRGIDRSNTVIFDARVIRENSLSVSVAPGIIASEGFATSSAPGGNGDPITGTYADTALRATFGRCGYAEGSSSITESTTVTKYAEQLQTERAGPLVVIGDQQFIGVGGVDVGDFDEGDTVGFVFDAGLGVIEQTLRLKSYRVSVSSSFEELEVTFV